MENITIHLGQAGCQAGERMWELMRREHDINANGDMEFKHDDESANTFFQETNSGQWVPRALFADLDPTTIDFIRSNEHRKLYHPDNLLNYMEDAAGCWAIGRYSNGRQLIEPVVNRLRKLMEYCNSLQGFLQFYAVGGGTGGGFGALMRETVVDDFFRKKQVVGLSIYPSPSLSPSIVEPYNAVLATHTVELRNDVNLVFDNEAMYDICRYKLGVQRPSYINLNILMAQCVSSMTQSQRFDGELNMDFNEFSTNLIPFPRINLLMTALAPLQTAQSAQKECQTVQHITDEAFANRNLMVKCNFNAGKVMAASLVYRGDVTPRDVNTALTNYKLRNEFRFVDWCPTMFKVGISYQLPTRCSHSAIPVTRRSVTLFCNATPVLEVVNRIEQKQRIMWNKNCFKHWYTLHGMEESMMEESLENLMTLREDYRWAGTSNANIQDFASPNYNFAGMYNPIYD